MVNPNVNSVLVTFLLVEMSVLETFKQRRCGLNSTNRRFFRYALLSRHVEACVTIQIIRVSELNFNKNSITSTFALSLYNRFGKNFYHHQGKTTD